MPRRLLFMPDYYADPFWDLETEGMVDLDTLPLRGPTRGAVRRWAARWERAAWAQLEEAADDIPEDELKALERDGLVVWERVRRELGDDWQVGWASFPDGDRHVQWQPGGPVVPCVPGSSTR